MCEKSGIPLAVIAGPTASGKTALAIELALRMNGEIVSADSMQVYREMEIATAKPSIQERRGVPHHLMDFLPPEKTYSVAEYVQDARRCIDEIASRGKLPILTGGTGLYIQSVVDNIEFSPAEADEALRKSLGELAEQKGGEALLEILREFDPETAERLHPNNLGRIIRAIEIYRVTGITMSESLRRSREHPSPYITRMLLLSFENRETLYQRINQRVDAMMDAGLMEEARRMYRRRDKLSATALQAIGYKELFPYFSGLTELETAINRMKMETRRYAKRQISWFKRDTRFHPLFVDKYPDFDYIRRQAEEYLQVLL
ncbi:MAG TPA: tRNA (adenosine(37)-N6)-dimethylallyltransferase MiaA [Firmicutes bacterium]|nr:tRNA (adenosine(37)-N6)-dimethylallyltransferase MiaA [Bacillota bacterium]